MANSNRDLAKLVVLPALIALAGVSGCFNPSLGDAPFGCPAPACEGQSGGPCCPEGFQCIAATCRRAAHGDAGLDSAADGSVQVALRQERVVELLENQPRGVELFEGPSAGKVVLEDSFSADALGSHWRAERRGGALLPGMVSLKDGALVIAAAAGTAAEWGHAAQGAVTAHTALPDGDFEARVKLSVGELQEGTYLGLFLADDSTRYVALERGRSIGYRILDTFGAHGHGVQLDSETVNRLGLDYFSAKTLWLRVRREGQRYLLAYSLDGQAFHVIYHTGQLGFTPARIGLLGRNLPGASGVSGSRSFSGSFDEFVLLAGPKDNAYYRLSPLPSILEIFPAAASVDDNPSSVSGMGWTNLDGIKGGGDGAATTERKSDRYYETEYLTASYAVPAILPDDADIVGVVLGVSAYISQQTPSHALMNMAYAIRVGDRGWSQRKGSQGLQSYGEHWVGSPSDLWDYAGPITGEEIKKGLHARFWCGGVQDNQYVDVDWMALRIAYRTRRGTFLTATVPSPTVEPSATARWYQLAHAATVPAGTGVGYDVIREQQVLAQDKDDGVVTFGTSTQWSVAQSFQPTAAELSSVTFAAARPARTGTAAPDLVVRLRDDQTILTSARVRGDLWRDDAMVNVNLDVEGLDQTKTYLITLEPSPGSASGSFSFSIKASRVDPYSKGRALTWDSAKGQWVELDGGKSDLCFTTYQPEEVLKDQAAPAGLGQLSLAPFKLRGRLSTSNLLVSPSIDSLTVTWLKTK